MDRPKWQQDIDEHLRERKRSDRWFLRWVALPTVIALAVGSWLGWFPGM